MNFDYPAPVDTHRITLPRGAIALLFAGAMSFGICLRETEAGKCLAVDWLTMFLNSNWFVVTTSMTNVTMKMAPIVMSLPAALGIAPHLNVAG